MFSIDPQHIFIAIDKQNAQIYGQDINEERDKILLIPRLVSALRILFLLKFTIETIHKRFVDLVLNNFHNILLMMNTNERIDEMSSNKTSCKQVLIELKQRYQFFKET